jgi:hypothetical protein
MPSPEPDPADCVWVASWSTSFLLEALASLSYAVGLPHVAVASVGLDPERIVGVLRSLLLSGREAERELLALRGLVGDLDARRTVVALAIATTAGLLLLRRLVHVVRVLRTRVGIDRVGLNDLAALARAQHPDRAVVVLRVILLGDRRCEGGLLVLRGCQRPGSPLPEPEPAPCVWVASCSTSFLLRAEASPVDAVGLPHVAVGAIAADPDR